MKRVLIVLVLAAALAKAPSAHAGFPPFSLEITPTLGTYLTDSTELLSHGFLFGLHLGLNLHEWVAIEMVTGFSPLSHLRGDESVWLAEFRWGGVLHIPVIHEDFIPFFTAGLGVKGSLADLDPQFLDTADWDLTAYWGVGAKYLITDWFGLRLDLHHIIATDANPYIEPEFVDPATREVRGEYINAFNNFEITVGAIFVLFGTRDKDKDGIVDKEDKCPLEPEDRDGFEDEDGCPDPDNDQDGIADAMDQCPNEAEDKDGFQDEDGCPDPDNDQDRIADAMDQCPNEAENYNNFEDHDGCPERDTDGDGIWDKYDRCVNEPEDKDGFQDEDGCPDPDNDQDGIADLNDKCPNEPETYNGIDDQDGCPDKGLIVLAKNQIQILETIHFATNRATILKRSHALLDQVANLLRMYKKLRKIRIEGHTDDRGSDRHNLKLSQGRSASVRAYLLKKGVEPDRLEAQGYGEAQPIASNKTKEGRAENRRVVFTILAQ